MPSRLVSVCDSRLSDASGPQGGQFSSSDGLLAFREFFTRRPDTIGARDFSTFPDLDQHSHDPSLCEDAASDLAECGDSVQHYSSSHGHSGIRGTMRPPDSRSKQGGPLNALSVARAGSERVAPDTAPLLAEGDTFLDLYGDPSRPPNISSPTNAEYAHSEEIHDSLPDFLDLSPDIESPQSQQVTHKIPPFGDVSRFLTGDESPAVVPEGEMAGPFGGRNPKRFGGDWTDPVLAKPPTSTGLVPRRVQSAAELAPGGAVYARAVALDRASPAPTTTYGNLQRSDSYGRRYPAQVLSARAAAFRAEMTGGGYARTGYDASTGPVAKYDGGHAYSRSAVEPSDLWRGDSYYNKRVQDLRNGDIQNLKRGVSVVVDAESSRESLSREMGPAVQRNRMVSPQDVVGPVSPTLRRPRASSAALSPTPLLSSLRQESRYRTLGDRAYHHPDVPRTPLFAEYNYDPPSWGSDVIAAQSAQPWGLSTGRDSDIDDRPISSPETESTFPSPQSDYSQNSLNPGPQPARPRHLRALSGAGGDESYPSRESYAPHHARRPGSSSPDLPRGHSLNIGLPSALLGIGLSTVDNGAFEAPRPAPAVPGPRSQACTQEKGHPPVARRQKLGLRILTGSADKEHSERARASTVLRKPLRSLSLSRNGSQRKNGAAVAAAPVDRGAARSASPLVGFGAMSQIWSNLKVQRPSERSDAPVGRLRAAGKSEPDFKTSFMETDAKPQKRGLLFRKKS